MYSPSRKVRASVRRSLFLIVVGCFLCLLLVQSFVSWNEHNENVLTPTQSAGRMLNRSQILLGKQVILQPYLFRCSEKLKKTTARSSSRYPLYIIVKTRAVSAGLHFQRRMFTRTSWAREARAQGIPVIYAIGRSTDEHVQQLLDDENRMYGDLLQFNHIDAYYNISIKTTGILRWFINNRCHRRTPYLLIVDDDLVINFPALMKMFSTNVFKPKTLYGLYLADIEPHPSGKWAVSLADYPNRTYPAFITGATTLYPTKVITSLVNELDVLIARNQSIFFLDDVLITGILAERAGISRAAMKGIEDCSYTDLYTRTIISECSHMRRIYVWSKFILKRHGLSTAAVDRLIDTTTYLKWRGDFKHMRNGTPIIVNSSVKAIPLSLSLALPSMYVFLFFLLLFILISMLISKCFFPHPISVSKPSSTSTSSMLLAPIQ